jgi:hypothetical protein
MSFSYAVLIIWSLFEGLNDFGILAVDLKVRGLLLLLFFIVAVLEALGVIHFRLPAVQRNTQA